MFIHLNLLQTRCSNLLFIRFFCEYGETRLTRRNSLRIGSIAGITLSFAAVALFLCLGKAKDGKQIAVKRLSVRSSQGNEEFMNEVKVLANFQHRNLVKLLGCCAEGPERWIVYEYLPNRSLHTFLFDPYQHGKLLEWQTRYKIIMGIAGGLRYLLESFTETLMGMGMGIRASNHSQRH